MIREQTSMKTHLAPLFTFYKGVFGDAVNALLAAAAYNFKRAMRLLGALVEKNQRDTLLEKCLASIEFLRNDYLIDKKACRHPIGFLRYKK